ncbi:MAG TPA: glycosidase, partial [Acidimicrobiia bacterium]|nr:glycosidase [Acidimicrobiia bacterium]
MSGSVDETGEITLEPRHESVSNGERMSPDYSRSAFAAKLEELGLMTATSGKILALVPERFTAEQLQDALGVAVDSDVDRLEVQDSVKRMHWLADSNYEVRFDADLPLSEHVISPGAPAESRGIEDARFVRFTDDDGSIVYYATYTAYDGLRILPQLIETRDFINFRMATMTGPAIHHKGMAIFPRKIDGDYVALSRHDHERSFVLRSDSVRSWTNAELVFGPETEWDIVQTGNCGSPMETEAGWLVITHGVGAMRRYVLGAVLLDLDEPTKVLGRLRTPLIEAEGEERSGYVPDVVYSCGSMVHAGNVIIPFGYSDNGIKIAVTTLDELLEAMD